MTSREQQRLIVDSSQCNNLTTPRTLIFGCKRLCLTLMLQQADRYEWCTHSRVMSFLRKLRGSWAYCAGQVSRSLQRNWDHCFNLDSSREISTLRLAKTTRSDTGSLRLTPFARLRMANTAFKAIVYSEQRKTPQCAKTRENLGSQANWHQTGLNCIKLRSRSSQAAKNFTAFWASEGFAAHRNNKFPFHCPPRVINLRSKFRRRAPRRKLIRI